VDHATIEQLDAADRLRILTMLRDLFDTPEERREFVRHILVGLSTALLAVWIAKHSKVI